MDSMWNSYPIKILQCQQCTELRHKKTYHSFEKSTEKCVITEDSSFKHDCKIPTESIHAIIF